MLPSDTTVVLSMLETSADSLARSLAGHVSGPERVLLARLVGRSGGAPREIGALP